MFYAAVHRCWPAVRGATLQGLAALRAALGRPQAWLALLALVCAHPAQAHIKWFNPQFNLMLPPRSLSAVAAHAYFLPLLVAGTGAMFFSTVVDRRLWRWRPLRGGLQSLDAWAQDKTYPFLRCMIALFFVVLAWEGQVMLTPESRATATWVSTLQLGIAIMALRPATGVAAGIGILLLYGMCIEKLGLFHMLDYPAFIGAALVLMLPALRRERLGLALVLLRVTTAASLMVGAAEKWGYPQWSFDLLKQNPVLRFGVSDLDFYMLGAGLVEFALAFLILLGNVSARVAALAMFALMASAIALFGWMDAVGHALFLAALLALAVTPNPLERAFHFHGRHGVLVSAGLVSLLFVLLLVNAVCFYREANIQLITLCTTNPVGQHLHR